MHAFCVVEMVASGLHAIVPSFQPTERAVVMAGQPCPVYGLTLCCQSTSSVGG